MINFKSKKEIAKVLQYTNCYSNTTKKEMIEHLEICRKYGFNAAMVSPCYVPLAKEYLKGTDIKVASTVNFPTANDSLEMKLAAEKELIKAGVDEFDFPPFPGYLLGGEEDLFYNEIKQVVNLAHQHGVKVKAMLEFGFLNEQQKIRAVELACQAGIDWVKNSSGGGAGGSAANVEDIKLMKAHIFGNTRIKASGKVNSLEKLKALFAAGAELAGTSSAPQIMEGVIGDEQAY